MRSVLLRTAFVLLSLLGLLPGLASAAASASAPPITVTLVRWPYT